MNDCWNPAQYQKFAKERELPFFDLLHLLENAPNMRVVDLGCGTGKLTQVLHNTLHAAITLGIDSSASMMSEAPQAANLHFELQSIENFKPTLKYDLIFSNAALQWLPSHKDLIGKLTTYLTEKGQIAIQMPSNFDSILHTTARALANQPIYRPYIDPIGRPLFALTLEEYSELFYGLGFQKQKVQARIYPLLLDSSDSALEWVKGTLLTYYQSRLPQDLFHKFFQEYSFLLKENFREKTPLFLPFKRLLLWAQI